MATDVLENVKQMDTGLANVQQLSTDLHQFRPIAVALDQAMNNYLQNGGNALDVFLGNPVATAWLQLDLHVLPQLNRVITQLDESVRHYKANEDLLKGVFLKDAQRWQDEAKDMPAIIDRFRKTVGAAGRMLHGDGSDQDAAYLDGLRTNTTAPSAGGTGGGDGNSLRMCLPGPRQ